MSPRRGCQNKKPSENCCSKPAFTCESVAIALGEIIAMSFREKQPLIAPVRPLGGHNSGGKVYGIG
jgi:hypothetical protein